MEEVVGRATVMQQFLVSEKKEKVAVAGCRVGGVARIQGEGEEVEAIVSEPRVMLKPL